MLLPGPGPLTYISPGARALGNVDIAWLIGLAVSSCAFSRSGATAAATTRLQAPAPEMAGGDGQPVSRWP
jgi:hypothetical protein